MKRFLFHFIPASAFLLLLFTSAAPAEDQRYKEFEFPVPESVGDERMLTKHLDQAEINSGKASWKQILAHGRFLFETSFTEADGRGRPGQNGNFPASARAPRTGVDRFNRITGPEADSCSGCHNKPFIGGGGDNVANIFSSGQRFSFLGEFGKGDENGQAAPLSLSAVGNERNTVGMFGAGPIEMLAREMTAELHAQRAKAIKEAAASGREVTVPLVAKGVMFGSLTARPDGKLNTDRVEGVDPDLIIKPFGQKGTVTSLREFANNAFFQHHGLQSTERFGKDTDPDGDGVKNELTEGDITAATLFQASLWVPGQVIPRVNAFERAIGRGDSLFRKIGCASCHVPEMKLESRYFTEPNPYNPPTNLRPGDVPRPFKFDMTADGAQPRIQREGKEGATLRCFTDLKRHNMGNDPLMANETVMEGGVPTNVFLTKKLWGFVSEPHFLHNGRATLISEAILAHGGEGQASRDAYAALPEKDRRCVIEFLKSLRALPEGQRFLVVDEKGMIRDRVRD